MEYHKGLIFLLIAMEILLSGYIVYEQQNNTSFCIVGKGCESLQDTIYAHILGIKVSQFGLIMFILFLITYFLTYKNKISNLIYYLSAILGSIFAIYFISIQLFITKILCSTCLIIDFAMLLIGILTLYDFIKKNN